jgi:hypothetical protein
MPVNLHIANNVQALNINLGTWKMKVTTFSNTYTFHLGSEAAEQMSLDACIKTIESAKATGATLEIYLKVKPPAAGPVYSKTVKLIVAAFAPSLKQLDSVHTGKRITNLAAQMESAANADVFLVPEYFHNWDRGGVVPSSLEQLDADLDRIRNLSGKYAKTILIAGTIVWLDEKKKCRNSAFVFLNGERVPDDNGTERRRYDKAAIDYEKSFVTGHNWEGGATPFYDFTAKGLKCRLEICKDSGTRPDATKDLQLVVASGLALAAKADTHVGGWCIHVDGEGFSIWQQPRQVNRTKSDVPMTVREIEIGIP